ncbi:MAG: diacylglycerol kinase family protein [Bacillota bacterium]
MHLLRSFKDAFAGLFYCFATQRNMTIHAVAGLCVLAFAYWLHVPLVEMLLLLAAVFAVLTAEAVNTALEKAVDVATMDQHELAHIAKDVAAGAVLLTAVFAVITGLAVLGPRVWLLLGF